MFLSMENTKEIDMVEYFGENLDGYIFTEKAWVQSYGTRCVKHLLYGVIFQEINL